MTEKALSALQNAYHQVAEEQRLLKERLARVRKLARETVNDQAIVARVFVEQPFETAFEAQAHGGLATLRP